MASDATLLRASRAGDQQAFGRLVRRHQSLVCTVTYSSTGDLSASEDLAQETFLTAWRKLDSLRDPTRLRGWLCAIARNLALQWRRQRQGDVISGAVSVEQAGHLESATPTPVQHALSAERASVVWGALNEMPEEYRIPLVLYYREQQSVGRVAEALDLSRSAVKSRLMRGRSMLKDKVVTLVEETLTATRPGDTFAVAVVAAIAGVAGKKAAGAGSTLLGLSLAKAAAIGAIAVGAAVGGGVALERLGGGGGPTDAAPAVAAEAPEPAQPTTFNSQVAFIVAVLDEGRRMVGTTPSKEPLTIPPGKWWYVEPQPPVDMEKVRQEVEVQRIPGLKLTDATDADLRRLKGLTALRLLDLQGTQVTDVGLEHMKGLAALQWLELRGTQVTDAGMEHLKGLSALQHLYLTGTKVTDAGLERLKGLTTLETLDLKGTRVTDAGLEYLKGLTALGGLELSNTSVTSAGVESLEGLTALRGLGLSDTKVTDSGLEHLKGLTVLQGLDLRGAAVTDAGLEHLKSLTTLQHLDLFGTKVTDAGLDHLKGLTQLRYLILPPAVTDAGVGALQKSLPRLKVTTNATQMLGGFAPVALPPPQAMAAAPQLGASLAPLHAAALAGNRAEVERLLAGGADVNARGPEGRTPVHYAAEAGRLEVVELLVEKRADVNAEDTRRRGPLHLAAQGGHREVAEALLKAGAEVNATDFDGWTPTGYAVRAKHQDLADLLARSGGVE
jgi:RNA polymerase sigma factor (sigma-70 family)